MRRTPSPAAALRLLLPPLLLLLLLPLRLPSLRYSAVLPQPCLIAVDGEAFLEGKLEPVAAGDAVAGVVVEVLVAHDACTGSQGRTRSVQRRRALPHRFDDASAGRILLLHGVNRARDRANHPPSMRPKSPSVAVSGVASTRRELNTLRLLFSMAPGAQGGGMHVLRN